MRQQSMSNRLAYIIIVLLCIIIALAIYAIKEFNMRSEAPSLPTQASTSTQKEVVTTKATTTQQNDLYKGITDAGFVSFASTAIDTKCPFYKPDGVTYHECLSDWMESLEKKLLVEQVDEVHGYCEMFSNKYADKISFESSELFTKCAIYKLQP